MKDKEKELTAVIETVLREAKNCDMSIETLTDYLVDRIKNKFMIEDSIILSRKEYEKLKYTWITDSDAYKKGCKETAEKYNDGVVEFIKNIFDIGQINFKTKIELLKENEKLAKQFGIEIKE